MVRNASSRLAAFWALQLVGVGIMLLCVVLGLRSPNHVGPVILLGTFHGHCCLSAAATAIGPPPFVLRLLCCGTIVVGEETLLLGIYKMAHRLEFALGNFIAIGLLAILVWIAIQVPSWL